jgi:transposase-like protein
MSENGLAPLNEPRSHKALGQTGPKRKKAQRKRDAKRMVDLMMQGVPKTEIARQFGISRVQLYHDWKKVEQQWAREIQGNVNEMKGREVALTYHIQNEALEAWDKSKEESVKTMTESVTTEKGSGVTAEGERVGRNTQLNRAQIKKEANVGDPRFLQIAASQSDARRKILGLDAPTKQATQLDVNVSGATELHIRLQRYAAVLGVEDLTVEEASYLLSGDGLSEPVDTERSLPETG